MDPKVIDRAVESAREAFGIPGVAVAIVRGDETYVQGYGEKELGKGEPVTPDTLFAVGSVTKAFTTTAMAMLVDQGKMGWDDHPRKHVPGFKLSDALADANVTLRDCVSHRTGLARHDCLWYNSKWDSQELLRKAAHLPLAFSFRSTYQYNNLMYMVAGLAVESASGSTWEKLIRSRIFKPLAMSRSTTSVNDLAKAGDYCTPHEKKEDEVVAVPWCNVDSVGACGSIISCARDLANWVRFQLGDGNWKGKQIVSKENLSETHSPQMIVPVDEPSRDLAETTISSYCLGWNLLVYRDWTIVSHGGAIDGFNAGAALVPKAGLGVAILSNLSNDMTVWAMRNAILDHLLDLSPKDWNAEIKAIQAKNREKAETAKQERAAKRVEGTQPTHELAAYAGEYADDAYGTATVSLDNSKQDSAAGKLCFAWNNHRATLEHWHFDTFAGKYEPPDWPVPIEILFTLDSDGAIAALRLIWPESGLDRAFARAKSQLPSPGGQGRGEGATYLIQAQTLNRVQGDVCYNAIEPSDHPTIERGPCMDILNFRSDTQTLPTEEMLDAMRGAELGDDVFGEDPTVNRLEEMSARMLGKEAALLVISGTMGNLVSLMTHASGLGGEVIVDPEAHVFYYEGGGLCTIAGWTPMPVASHAGMLDPDEVAAAIRKPNIHFPTPRLLCLEN